MSARPGQIALSHVLGGLRRAALLHDVGKLAISNRILDKPERLTPFEFTLVREHPAMTRRILERVPGFSAIAPTAAAHHERRDGSGYPDGLTGGELTTPGHDADRPGSPLPDGRELRGAAPAGRSEHRPGGVYTVNWT